MKILTVYQLEDHDAANANDIIEAAESIGVSVTDKPFCSIKENRFTMAEVMEAYALLCEKRNVMARLSESVKGANAAVKKAHNFILDLNDDILDKSVTVRLK